MPQENTTIKIISSCKYLFIKSGSYTGAATGTVTITNTGTGISTSPYSLTYNGPGDFGQVMVDIADLSGPGGIYELDFQENSQTVSKKLVLLKCDIDCCLVKLTNELIDCACDCAKCATSLAKAQKIYLLIHSAETAIDMFNTSTISNQGYALDAKNKYKKAREICDASCGCDC